jgi:tetratricopeptide (TPR) repeat protein
MGRRFAGQALLGALALCGQLGCHTASPVTAPPALPAQAALAGPEKPGQKDLPPQDSARVCLSTAAALEKSGAELQAIGLYEKARLDDPRHMQHVCRRLGVLYDRQGSFARALEEYQKALQINPKDHEVLNDLGYAYYARGNLLEAEKYLRQALAVDPHYERAWVNLGMVLGEQQRYQESLGAFGKALPAAQAQCNLAFLLTTQGKREEARQAYRTALSLDPTLVLAQGAMDKLDAAGSGSAAGATAVASADRPGPRGPLAPRDPLARGPAGPSARVAAMRRAPPVAPAPAEGGWSVGVVKFDEPEAGPMLPPPETGAPVRQVRFMPETAPQGTGAPTPDAGAPVRQVSFTPSR